MPRLKHETLACWGNHPRHACESARPETWRALDESLRTDDALIPRGLGRSYGDASLNEDGRVVRMERLDRALAFDEHTGVLEAEAGLSIRALIETLLPGGWFPGVTPGTSFVTLGGAIAADVHGKNHHSEGSFARWTEGFELLLPSGEARWVSRDDDPELFHATLGGMGLTGVVRRCRVRMKRVGSAYVRSTYRRTRHLDETLEGFQDGFSSRTYSVAWIDCLKTGPHEGRAVLIGGEHARPEELPGSLRRSPFEAHQKRRKRVPFHFPGVALNPLSVKVFNALYYRAHGDDTKVESVSGFFHPLDSVLEWNRIYGSRGFQQYQVVVPFEHGRDAVRTLLDRIARSKAASFLAVLKPMGASSEGPLSFPMPGWTLALDLAQTPRLDRLLHELDAITIEFGGRRYLAKDASLLPEHLDRMYPRLDEFRALRERIDPEHRLSSSLSRRLGIDG